MLSESRWRVTFWHSIPEQKAIIEHEANVLARTEDEAWLVGHLEVWRKLYNHGYLRDDSYLSGHKIEQLEKAPLRYVVPLRIGTAPFVAIVAAASSSEAATSAEAALREKYPQAEAIVTGRARAIEENAQIFGLGGWELR